MRNRLGVAREVRSTQHIQQDIRERYPVKVDSNRVQLCQVCVRHGHGVYCNVGLLPVTMTGEDCIYYTKRLYTYNLAPQA